jgi:hypothetical protein
MPMKAVWHPKTSERQPESEREPYRCKNQARWKFTPLRGNSLGVGKRGTYCMTHLLMQLQKPKEEERVMRYWTTWTTKEVGNGNSS